ncbi:MAG TPA: hypothetical protein VFH15_15635 [Pyrinomonadaceae bacterium]|nr:hypothetical protein [Pyrinomonadaceae bacterium]
MRRISLSIGCLPGARLERQIGTGAVATAFKLRRDSVQYWSVSDRINER